MLRVRRAISSGAPRAGCTAASTTAAAAHRALLTTQIHRGTRILAGAIASCCLASIANAQSAPTPEQRALHALNRLTFGPRPGDVQRVVSMGLDKWIAQQLRPESIEDKGAALALVDCPIWTDPVGPILNSLASPGVVTMATPGPGATMASRILIVLPGLYAVRSDSIAKAGSLKETYQRNVQMFAGRLARAEASDQQLVEVMTDFWENHFSVYATKMPNAAALVEYDRVVIRPNALGKFRALLGAVAHSPAMLAYLDNAVSVADPGHRTLAPLSSSPFASRATNQTGLNENYGRELLELHTMGVDGGYTQQDVTNVARAFTGWTHSGGGRTVIVPTTGASKALTFVFDPSRHDADAKTILGVTFPADHGQDEGERVLDLLARHPSTARFIARKLAVRFVSDDPPASLVDRAAETFLRTDGDIREVMRAIVTSPEFFATEVISAKVKSPVELVLSMRRALRAPVDTAAQEIDLLLDLNQAPFGKLTPDGWPERGTAWLNFSGINARIAIAKRVAAGEYKTIRPESWPQWHRLVTSPFDAQMEGVIATILNGNASVATREAMASIRPADVDAAKADVRESKLRELIAMSLASPDFQRR